MQNFMFLLCDFICGVVTVVLLLAASVEVCVSSKREVCVPETFIEWLSRENLYKICSARLDQQSLLTSFLDWHLADVQLLKNNFPIENEQNFVRTVKNVVFSRTNATPFDGTAVLVAWSNAVLADLMDLNSVVTKEARFLDVFSGKALLDDTVPFTHRYGGHQFGVWAGQLGDGRAHLLGEYRNGRGERWELQLKGSGKTPYSRDGDGRAIVRSSIREFLASEAMYHLGIPTSRCGTLVMSSETVKRDLLYNGRITDQKTAVVLRLAPSWFRFGSLEILSKSGETDLLRRLVNFIIVTHFKEIPIYDSTRYLQFFSTVVEETALMIAHWQAVGFAHGVCNTDNFSILSITIDYGPFRFMDEYDPDMVPNLSDDEGRYRYSKQPETGRYNLEKLAESLMTLVPSNERSIMSVLLSGYDDLYQRSFLKLFRQKIGLVVGQEMEDENLIHFLLNMMAQQNADFSMTFRQLGDISMAELGDSWEVGKYWALEKLQKNSEFSTWVQMYSERLRRHGIEDEVRQGAMHKTNPRYVLRNWMAETAIRAVEQNEFSVIRDLARILQKPFEVQNDAEQLGYASTPPSWASHIEISCSS